jgi:hypothetical protein
MKNITVTVGDETYCAARVKAAELDTSVSALVKGYLAELATGETEFQRLVRLEQEVKARIAGGFRVSHRLTRDQVHECDA